MSSKYINYEFNRTIGLKLLRVRQLAGLSQENVANDLNFSPSTYSKLESGKIDFTATRLQQLADYFKVFAPDFLDSTLDAPRQQDEVRPLSDYKKMETKIDVLNELLRK
jgi:transcriptional regulator with XRE-family HTH domain